jgi:hypothetical protein
MNRYASGTGVSVDRSRAELDRLLSRYGASKRLTSVDDENGEAYVGFFIHERTVKLRIPLPKLNDFATKYDGRSQGQRKVSQEAQAKLYEQACRERWRVFVLLVKAKLETVELGLSTVEREFMADICLPNGRTVGQLMESVIQDAYATGKVPKLPAYTGES